MKVKTIGIVLETKDDAIKTASSIMKNSKVNIDNMYHWREPEEVAAVVQAIKRYGFEPRLLGTPQNFADNLQYYKNNVDFVLNLSTGFRKRFRFCESSSLLETLEMPYSGGDPYTRMMSQNKHLTKLFWTKMNIPTPNWVYIDSLTLLEEIEFPDFPLIIKPAWEDSSIGINANAVSYNTEEAIERIRDIIETMNMPALVERFITGREYKVCIIGNKIKKFTGMIEDINRDGSSMKNGFLYFTAKTNRLFCQVRRDIKQPDFEIIRQQSELIYDTFLPVDYGVFDIRVDDNGNHYFLEFNANSSLNPENTLATCCKLNGIEYDRMIGEILKTSFERWGIV